MTKKIRVGIVYGGSFEPRFLSIFEPLKDAFDTCIYAHHSERLITLHSTGMRLRLFENITEMPGFMRGLEEELSHMDMIIGVETSRLATFQALRAARRYGVPLAVVVNEYTPYLYEQYANLKAIKFDVTGKACHFWATTQMARSTLLLEHVAPEKVTVLPPVIDTHKFRFSVDGRRKFRDYVGLKADDVVMLLQHDLVPECQGEQLIKALHLLQGQIGGIASRLKLIFVGQGSAAMDYKYLAHDLGLGKQVFFLHQDPEPFLLDLYSAVDLMFHPKVAADDTRQDLPLALLEGMAVGIMPLVGAGTVAAELVAPQGLSYADPSGPLIAAQIQELVVEPKLLAVRRAQLIEHVRVRHHLQTVGPRFITEIEEIIATYGRQPTDARSPQSLVAAIEMLIKRGALIEAFVQIEEALLLDVVTPHERAEIFRLRGDAHVAARDYDRALESFQEGLLLNDHNFLCLRGMAQTYWQTHDNEAALTHFRRALTHKEGDADTMLGIAMVFRRLGLLDEAVVWLEKCVVRHQIPAAIIALAQTCGQLARQSTAIAVLNRALEVIGEHQTLMMALGQAYLSAGKHDEGQELLRRALASA
ncbi:MAG: glycosyltransferase [Deltaproteobacteria bacterium]|nr:glycosyltransferase [Deltaproteobacteria bacterium]